MAKKASKRKLEDEEFADVRPAASSKKEPETKSPDEWANATGHLVVQQSLGGKRLKAPDWKHAAASALHGWAVHQHHENTPILLTKADYEAALTAAQKLKQVEVGENEDKRVVHRYVPHKPALSPHMGKGV